MVLFAENEFRLNERQGDDASLRDIISNAARQLGKTPEEMEEYQFVPLPNAAASSWSMFLELDRARGGSGFGPNPIAYSEILAWSELMQRDVSPFEVATIKAIDRAYMSNQAVIASKKIKTPT